jgi:hypothetical protein
VRLLATNQRRGLISWNRRGLWPRGRCIAHRAALAIWLIGPLTEKCAGCGDPSGTLRQGKPRCGDGTQRLDIACGRPWPWGRFWLSLDRLIYWLRGWCRALRVRRAA